MSPIKIFTNAISQKFISYTKPAKGGFVCVAVTSSRQANKFTTSADDFYLCSFARRRIKSMIEYQKVLT
jgi:hypothetical protein